MLLTYYFSFHFQAQVKEELPNPDRAREVELERLRRERTELAEQKERADQSPASPNSSERSGGC